MVVILSPSDIMWLLCHDKLSTRDVLVLLDYNLTCWNRYTGKVGFRAKTLSSNLARYMSGDNFQWTSQHLLDKCRKMHKEFWAINHPLQMKAVLCSKEKNWWFCVTLEFHFVNFISKSVTCNLLSPPVDKSKNKPRMSVTLQCISCKTFPGTTQLKHYLQKNILRG